MLSLGEGVSSLIRKYTLRQEVGYRIEAISQEGYRINLVATPERLLKFQGEDLKSFYTLPTADLSSFPYTKEVRKSLVEALGRAVFSLDDALRLQGAPDLQLRPYLPFSRSSEDDFQMWIRSSLGSRSRNFLQITSLRKEAHCRRDSDTLVCDAQGFLDWTKSDLLSFFSNLHERNISLNVYPSSGRDGYWVAHGDFVIIPSSASAVSKHFLGTSSKPRGEEETAKRKEMHGRLKDNWGAKNVKGPSKMKVRRR
jgi:hypothetical protein